MQLQRQMAIVSALKKYFFINDYALLFGHFLYKSSEKMEE
jgi:hypothetical protein